MTQFPTEQRLGVEPKEAPPPPPPLEPSAKEKRVAELVERVRSAAPSAIAFHLPSPEASILPRVLVLVEELVETQEDVDIQAVKLSELARATDFSARELTAKVNALREDLDAALQREEKLKQQHADALVALRSKLDQDVERLQRLAVSSHREQLRRLEADLKRLTDRVDRRLTAQLASPRKASARKASARKASAKADP